MIQPGDQVVYRGRTIICVEPAVDGASVSYRYEEDGPGGSSGHTMMTDSWLWLAGQLDTEPLGKFARPGVKVRQR